jgi:hypothetical protein
MINRGAFLGTLKGPPLSVFLCFLIFGPNTALKPTFIARKTRYSRQAVYQALYFLHDHGLAQDLGSIGWVATPLLQQLGFDLLGDSLPLLTAGPEETVNEVDTTVNLVDTPPVISSSVQDLEQENTTTTQAPTVNEVDTLPDADAPPQADTSTTPRPGILALCRKHGIWPEPAAILAADPWVTEDRVTRWAALLRADPAVRSLPAVLYSNLKQHHEPPPPENDDQNPFLGGPYADYIEH